MQNTYSCYLMETQSTRMHSHDIDVSGFGMGLRRRYAMVVDNHEIKHIGVDPEVEKSSGGCVGIPKVTFNPKFGMRFYGVYFSTMIVEFVPPKPKLFDITLFLLSSQEV